MAKDTAKAENPGSALARMRAESLSPERRAEIASLAGKTSAANMTPAERTLRARKAARASAKARRKKGKK
jgi:hypothetical protein